MQNEDTGSLTFTEMFASWVYKTLFRLTGGICYNQKNETTNTQNNFKKGRKTGAWKR